MIVVIDTNVLVSGLLNPFGKPASIIRLVSAGELKLAFDTRIITEYNEVLHRPKFPFKDEQISPLLDQFIKEGISVTPVPLSSNLPDPDDEMFLEVAVSAHAEALATGHKDHFPKERCGEVQVLSPDEFLEYYL